MCFYTDRAVFSKQNIDIFVMSLIFQATPPKFDMVQLNTKLNIKQQIVDASDKKQTKKCKVCNARGYRKDAS